MLSTLDIATFIILTVFAIAYGYVGYTAIAISRTLSSRVYRNQALGLVVIATLTVELAIVAVISNSFTASLTGIAYAFSLLGIWFAIFIGFYYYIDASIVAARPTDPLFRDTLHWTRARLAFWAYNIGAAIVFPIAAADNVYNYASGGLPAFFQAEIPFLIIIFSGAVVLPIAIRKSKDRVLKKQLTWFFVWFVLFLLSLISSAPLLIALVVSLAGAYPLHRSATSLVPLYKFDNEPGKTG